MYPSYLGDKAAKWLKSQMQSLHDQVPFGELYCYSYMVQDVA